MKRADPLRRLTPTPLVANLNVMERTVRLETNSTAIFDCLVRLFERYTKARSAQPEFLWRIVSETEASLQPPWPEMSAFSDEGLRYVNLGQRSFFAVDLESRSAVGFLPEEWAKDELGFNSVFLATLCDLSARALDLFQVSAACVALAGNALLIFGPPRSGKTTSTYLAGRDGLEFHADQATFIEIKDDGVRAWGQPWPAAFRTETNRFLPELASSTSSFTYGTLAFSCFEKDSFQPPEARSVVPSCCVFLERQAPSEPRLARMSASELNERLVRSFPFQDDECAEPGRRAVLRALGELPAYHLPYGSDPAEAARLYGNLLKNHALVEGGS